MEKVDLKKTLKHLYRPRRGTVVEITVPTFHFVMLDGEGDPNTEERYRLAVESLFSVAYTAKFMVKKRGGEIDYAVMPLEGLWWADDMSSFLSNEKAQWKWTLMIMQPGFVSADTIHDAIGLVRRKRALSSDLTPRYEEFSEGLAVQTLHVGPFSEEAPTVARVHQYIDARGVRTGKHHEIYLSDIRRADPRRWRTIIRQPMCKR